MARPKLLGNIFYVYALIGADGFPFYIGKGCRKRWLDHEKPCALADESHRSHVIRQTMAALGHLPKLKLAENLSEHQAHRLERMMIAALGRRPGGLLTNKTDGGEGVVDTAGEIGRKISARKMGHLTTASAREKMRAAKLGKKQKPEHVARRAASNRGKILSADHIARLVSSKIGVPRSPETKAKISAKKKGIPRDPALVARSADGHRGQARSDETKAKMAAARVAWWARRRAGA